MNSGEEKPNNQLSSGGFDSFRENEEPEVGDRLGAYEVMRRIAQGGMATVYEVRHHPDGERRALKLLLPLAAKDETVLRFRREFRALSRMQHPHILRVFDSGMRGDRPWYTMEYLEGLTVKDQVLSWGNLAPEERFSLAQSLLISVTRALVYIHNRGFIHRDITPANIMVLKSGGFKLMDFGVVKDMGADLTAVGEIIGTVAYISPEQVNGGRLDARADLYSLGALLYTVITGSRPFQARTLHGYLQKHLTEIPRRPIEVDPLVPEHLDQICMRLLAKKPDERYASAGHLLYVLGEQEEDANEAVRWPPTAVGRTLIRARIHETIDDIRADSKGSAILLTGQSGQGKTRLLDLAESHARSRGVSVARGSCRRYDRPFGAFVGIYRDLVGLGSRPVLADVFSTEELEGVRERYPVISAFKELIQEMAPCLIIIDELQIADSATLELLQYLIRNCLELAEQSVSFVLAQEGGANGLTSVQTALSECPSVHSILLSPLSLSEVEELVLSLLPHTSLSLRLARRLHRISKGSPAYLSEMLRTMVEDGHLVDDSGRFRLSKEASDLANLSLVMPTSLRQALQGRIEPLSGLSLRVVRVLAIARQPIDLDTLVELSLSDEDDVLEALDGLNEADLVLEENTADGEQIALKEDRLREIVLDALSEKERYRLHRKMGEVLERRCRSQLGEVVEELSYQFEAAGIAPKAYAYLRRTAHRHLNRSLYQEALGFLDRALKMSRRARPYMLLDDADREVAEVRLARAQALSNLGRWPEAFRDAKKAERWASEIDDPRLQSRVSAELGRQARSMGDTREAERYLRSALDKAASIGDLSIQPMPLYDLGGLVWAKGKIEQAESLWSRALSAAEQTQNERAVGYGFNGLGILAFCQGRSSESRAHLERSNQIFERLGMLSALSIARVNLSELYLCLGLFRKALDLAERTISQAQEVGHLQGVALGLVNRSQILLELGRASEARQNVREALRQLRALGTSEDQVNALCTLARIDLEQGHYLEVIEHITLLTPLLVEHDTEGIGPHVRALQAEAEARMNHTFDPELLAPTETGWPHITVRTELARARAFRFMGQRLKAKRCAEHALALAQKNGYKFYQLQARHELVQVTENIEELTRHRRFAQNIARSLAANLSMADRKIFIARRWGVRGHDRED